MYWAHVLKPQQFAQVTPWLSLALRFTRPGRAVPPSGPGVQSAADDSCTEAVRRVLICRDTSVLGTNLCFYGSVPRMGPWPTGPRRCPKSSCAVTVPPLPPPRHTAFAPRLASPSLRSLDRAEVAQLTWCGWLVTCPPCLELSSTFGVDKGTPHEWGQVQASPRGGRCSRERGPAQCPCGCPPGQR